MKKLVYLENSQEHRWIRLFKALGALMALGLISSRVIDGCEQRASELWQRRKHGNGGSMNKK